jgi:hypothetical protein
MAGVNTFSTDFSLQNLDFGIYLNFQRQKSLKLLHQLAFRQTIATRTSEV